MPSQQFVAGASLLATAAFLNGCGDAPEPPAPPPPPPPPVPPPFTGCSDYDNYEESCLINSFGGADGGSFLWGAATAAAQIEGAWATDGKQPSTWDDFCHSIAAKVVPPATVSDTTNPDTFSKTCGKFWPQKDTLGDDAPQKANWTTLQVTDDFYHHYESDLQLLADYNMNAMRISLSWPRLMPLNATGQHEWSAEGQQFYDDVLDKMIALGITPVVALFHWDLPNDLSFLQESVVEAFADYADKAFEAFSGKIKDWVTFNEPTSICSLGYSIGAFAPGHQSTTDHLVCGKNLLMAHARAAQIFNGKYVRQDSQIGIVLDYKWTYPVDDTNEQDTTMAQWDRDNVIGFWADPIFGQPPVSGSDERTYDFPQSLKDFFGSDLPTLTDAEKEILQNSAAFYGANTYGGKLTRPESEVYNKALSAYTPGNDMAERYSCCPCGSCPSTGPMAETYASFVPEPTNFSCGAASSWLWAKPDSMYQYLNYIKSRYGPKIYVTEFGGDMNGEGSMTVDQSKNDVWRVQYYQLYMMQVAKAKNEGANVQGVFAWSLMDNFEWGDGLDFRFGITYVDFDSTSPTYMQRTPKDSGKWWQELIPKMNPGVATV